MRAWRKVQVPRPSASTSGGQSAGRSEVTVAADGGTLVGFLDSDLAMAIQDFTEVQERHL